MSVESTSVDQKKPNNLKVVTLCVGMVAGMGGLAYASVPLYELFCQVTGFGGTTQRVVASEDIPIIDREITVRFDANTSNGLNWEFGPEVREVKVKLGELKQISYVARNLTDTELNGTATFNVTPQELGSYFNKTQCFCFTETKIEAGGELDMPVIFFVDPDLDAEERFKNLSAITLSYTFFPTDGEAEPKEQAKATKVPIDETKDRL